MPTEQRPLKVFLCHAHADQDTVRALYTRLTRDGVDAWLDKEKLLPGQDWEYEIRKAVRESDVVVVCLSKQFNQAGFRQKEVRLALDTAMEQPEGEIFIIPARLEECETLESLKKWHWVDLFQENGYERLMRALRTRADKIGVTLRIKKSRSTRIRKSEEVLTTEKNTNNTNAFEPIKINPNSVIKTGNLDKVEHRENEGIEKEEIKKRRLPYFEAPITRDSATQQESKDISSSGTPAKREFPKSGEQISPKKPKGKRPVKTEYIVAIIGAAATIIAGILSSPLIERWFSPVTEPTVAVTKTSNPQIMASATNMGQLSAQLTQTALAAPFPTSENTSNPFIFNDPHPDSADYVDSKGTPMRLVPAGEFAMGSDSGGEDEKPVHEVYLDAFYMDKYEVTNSLYRACVEAGGCSAPPDISSYGHDNSYWNSQADNYPVINVTWNQAKAYCEWRGARLPTEAEWEKAARGPDFHIYPWGDAIDCSFANYSNCKGDITPVGSYEKGTNSYGIYDMAGNVWEWVADWYDANYYTTLGDNALNPQGPTSGQYRVLRGGAWSYNINYVRSTSRNWVVPDTRNNFFGFRCAKHANP
jgi:formylglycine-generating enzyme required for sulfatase activity